MQLFYVDAVFAVVVLTALFSPTVYAAQNIVESWDGGAWYCLGDCSPAKSQRSSTVHLKSRTSLVPGLLLAGGGADSTDAFRWAIHNSDGGDFLVLRSTGTNAYDSWLFNDLRGLRSAQTLIINNTRGAQHPLCLEKIRSASALFFAGGDQFNYVKYFNLSSAEMRQELRQRQNVLTFGGTSAGLAIQGEFLFTAGYGSVTSRQSLEDPGSRAISIGHEFLADPLLKRVVTDSHFADRDRMGRLVAFLARIQFEGWERHPRGMGIDESVTLLVDAATGIGRVVSDTKTDQDGAVYFLEATEAPRSSRHEPLTLEKVMVIKIKVGGSFDVRNWRTVSSSNAWAEEYSLAAEHGKLHSEGHGGEIY